MPFLCLWLPVGTICAVQLVAAFVKNRPSSRIAKQPSPADSTVHRSWSRPLVICHTLSGWQGGCFLVILLTRGTASPLISPTGHMCCWVLFLHHPMFPTIVKPAVEISDDSSDRKKGSEWTRLNMTLFVSDGCCLTMETTTPIITHYVATTSCVFIVLRPRAAEVTYHIILPVERWRICKSRCQQHVSKPHS